VNGTMSETQSCPFGSTAAARTVGIT
jgi:hypothetical protein